MTEAEPDVVLVALPNADVVWGLRTASDRAVLTSIPTPSSGFRWMDEVRLVELPVADLTVDATAYQVLAAPERTQDSGIPTTLAVVAVADAADLATLIGVFGERGWCAEDWTDETTVVCAACAELDQVPDDHRHDADRWFERREIAIAAQPTELETTLRLWIDDAPARRLLLDLDEAL